VCYPWQSAEWNLVVRVLPQAHRGLARAWWTLLTVRAVLPALLVVGTGALVGAVSTGQRPGWSLALVAGTTIGTLVLSPVHDAVSTNLGAQVGADLHRRLLQAATEPLGIEHLEDPALADDFTLARDFDLGITGPPVRVCMSFVANGLVPVAKELRLFGLAPWTVGRFGEFRRQLLDLSLQALRLRERSLLWAALAALAGNGLCVGALASAVLGHEVSLGHFVTFIAAVVGTAVLGIADFDWWFDTAARPAVVVDGIEQKMPAVTLRATGTRPAAGLPRQCIRLRAVSFGYRGGDRVLDGVDLEIPAGTSLAIVGQNGAGKTTLAKLLCRLYDPSGGRIEADGVDLRDLDLPDWRSRLTTVFQDYVRYELSLRDNVAPSGARDADVEWALRQAGAADLAADTTVLSKSYEGGTDLSGGQWQRVALARAMCAVRQGAGLIILDEPTAQLDVRGEAEIFRRLLHATKGVTTILISHRFSTVRQADRICVLEGGRVAELGSHDELMARGGRYARMFTLQAARFTEDAAAGEETLPASPGAGT
jgi:ATP-binding cassette subfamily B protein